MITKNRQLNSAESKKLLESIRQMEEIASINLNWLAIVVLSLLTVLSAIHIYYYDKSNWSLISKGLVCYCPIVIWVMVESKYKDKKRKIESINYLKEIERSNSVDVVEVNASRVVKFAEEEDEGVLYLIEVANEYCFYLWDDQFMISEDFFLVRFLKYILMITSDMPLKQKLIIKVKKLNLLKFLVKTNGSISMPEDFLEI